MEHVDNNVSIAISSRLSPRSSSPCLTHYFVIKTTSSSSSSSSEMTGRHSGRSTMYSSSMVSIIDRRQLIPALRTSFLLCPQASGMEKLSGFRNCLFLAAAAKDVMHPTTLPYSDVPTPWTSCWYNLVNDILFDERFDESFRSFGTLAESNFPRLFKIYEGTK